MPVSSREFCEFILRPPCRTLSNMSLTQDLQYALEVARGAGRTAMEFFGNVERQTKTHAATTDEAVTEADRATQRFIVAALRKRFPDDGVIGEESDLGDAITNQAATRGQRVWVIDPIDGTNNFIGGFPNFAVCIGLLDAGAPALGQGCWLGNRRLHALTTPLSDSSLLMMTSNCIDSAGRCPEFARRWMGQTNWKLRILGSAALEAAQVAAGIAHGAVTINGKLWDAAAPASLVLEAGGTFTDLKGGPIFPFDLTRYAGAKVPFLAAGPAAHEQLLREIRMWP
jgi:myo-inositol-1(or 4)-monophosphatase